MMSQKQVSSDLLSEVTLEGLVELGTRNKVTVVVDPESRSRISYYIQGELAEELESYIGSIVIVTGKLTGESKSKWSKNINIISYQVVVDNTPKVEEKAFWKFWLWFS